MNKQIIQTPSAPAPIGPYSQAVMTNGILFISGQIPLNPLTNEVVRAGIRTETRQVMENLKAILSAAGMNFNNVVKCSIFIKEMNDFGSINEVYGSYFTTNFPARETVEVARLPKDANIEISAVAVV